VSAVLVVDDNEDNRYTLLRRLKREGYEDLTVAESGERALDLLTERTFDIVLLDVMMPGLNGYQVLERMRADRRTRDIPVIMISALDEIESVVRCIELGAEDYLSKPFNATLLRARIGASLEKKRLRDALLQHTLRMEKELATARELQLSMVPAAFPRPSAECPLAVHGTLQPAREVGGDLYDCFRLDPQRLCLVVADVSDKGACAALFMARTKTAIRLLATQMDQGPERPLPLPGLVARINDELCRDNPLAMFVTLVIATVDGVSGEVAWCNAGHTFPYTIGADGSVTALCECHGIPLGVKAAASFRSARTQLARGGAFFAYTDGITEAADEHGRFFGEAGLEAALRSCAGAAPEDLVAGVLRDVRSFAGSAAPSDDIAALACRWHG
jgi:sigma-B regulation protein RsbU (phosphoserine phosphatase)